MLNWFEDEGKEQDSNQDTYGVIGKGVGILIMIIAFLLLLPILIGSVVVALLLVVISKFREIKFTKTIIGIFFAISCICIVTNYQIITSFTDVIEIPVLTDFVRSRLTTEWFEKTPLSYIFFISTSIGIGTILYMYIDFIQNRKIETKEDLNNKKLKTSLENQSSKKINNINLKHQAAYRKDPKNLDILLGIDNFAKRFMLKKQELNAHAFVSGTTGAGKTTLILNVIESFSKSNLPVIMIDGKGDPTIVQEVKNVANLFNRKTYVFNENNDLTYNPLKNGNRTVVVDRLMNIFDWSEEYYQSQARNILLKIVMFIDDYNLNRDLKTLNQMLNASNIIKVLNNDYTKVQKTITKKVRKKNDDDSSNIDLSEMSLSEKKEYLKNKEQNKEEYEEIQETTEVIEHSDLYYKYCELFFETKGLGVLEGDRLTEVIEDFRKKFNGLKAQIENLLLTDIGELVEDKDDGLDIEKVLEEKAVLVFSFETVKYPQFMKTFSRFVIEDIATVMSGQFETETKTLLVADEFGSYGTSRIIDLLARLRSAGLHALIGTQTVNDLVVDGVDLSGKIFGSTNTYMIGKVNDDEEADRLSKLFGTYEDVDITTQTEDSIKSKLIRREVKSEKGTMRNVNKFHTKPDNFKSLPNHSFYTYRKANSDLKGTERYSKIYIRNNQKGIERGS